MRRVGWAAIFGAAFAAILLPPPRPSLAWGPQGHRIVALIADRVLQQSDPAVRAKILAVLATDKENRWTKTDIAGEATWADVLRDKSEEARDATAQWHSVRLKPDNPDLAAACFGHTPLPAGYPASHGPRENCVVDKLAQFADELKNPETSPGERLTALQFVLNLAGDLHDPLYAIDHGDQGGACVALQIGAKPPVRLSSYWQETLVSEAAAGPDAAKGAARIAAGVSAADGRKWTAEGEPATWARETYQIAKEITYGFAPAQPAGTHSFPPRKGQAESCTAIPLYRVEPDYAAKAAAAVREQLAKAGFRLAAMLRDGFK